MILLRRELKEFESKFVISMVSGLHMWSEARTGVWRFRCMECRGEWHFLRNDPRSFYITKVLLADHWQNHERQKELIAHKINKQARRKIYYKPEEAPPRLTDEDIGAMLQSTWWHQAAAIKNSLSAETRP